MKETAKALLILMVTVLLIGAVIYIFDLGFSPTYDWMISGEKFLDKPEYQQPADVNSGDGTFRRYYDVDADVVCWWVKTYHENVAISCLPRAETFLTLEDLQGVEP